MIKIQNNLNAETGVSTLTATRDPLPSFLVGLAPESLADLSWTDPALGVSDCAWWPEVDQSPVLGEYERYGAETLAVDAANQRVIVTRTVVSWSAEEIAQAQAEAAESLQAEIVAATQQRLDEFARTRNYDSILSAATYATSTNPKFKAEGQYAMEARDATWAKLYEMLAEVEAGNRPAPSGYADIEAELPVLEWPA